MNAEPKQGEIIYHYCSKYVFWSILEQREMWFSDIFALNDATEIRWGHNVFKNVMRDNRGRFDQVFRIYMIVSVFGVEKHVRPFLGCFSAARDLLSQWRAYADDGQGFALGFSAREIWSEWGTSV